LKTICYGRGSKITSVIIIIIIVIIIIINLSCYWFVVDFILNQANPVSNSLPVSRTCAKIHRILFFLK